MLSGYEIIVFSDELDRHPFSCQHIMEHFFDSNRIIWVTPTGMRNPKLSPYDLKRAVEKIWKWLSPERTVSTRHGEVTRIAPVALPYNNVRLIRVINNLIVRTKVSAALTEGRGRIIITTLPITADYVDCFDADAIVYYIVDDFIEWPGIDRDFMVLQEERLIAKADLLMASSTRLCEIKTRGKRPVLIPHGVDYEHFCRNDGASLDSVYYSELPRPIIGFFGAVSPWIDFDLIIAAATAHRDWSFVFVGPIDADISVLKEFGNVHFRGKVSYAEIPGHARRFDVGIIPFLINDLTVSVNPLKLLEYFACGLPVVTTALPEVFRFKEHLYIARDTEEFILHLKNAIQDSSKGREDRQRLAGENSWRSVAEKFSSEIEAFLTKHEATNLNKY